MKIVIMAIAAIMGVAACNNSNKQTTVNDSSKIATVDSIPGSVNAAEAPQIKFEKATYDFGVINSGEKVTHEFKFTNTGKSPLIISNAQASCGCTVPEKPEKPINPGEEGIIKVVFDSTGKTGMQNKMITITSNAIPATSELHLIGNIKEAKTK
ncbi:MAG TPA: DUF1573 domain-containing protein [Sphingobacteriaceae bacterium]|nr:DUF1573 domain-containing protein [Sphingobacteriaceae bacterium]